VIDFNVVDVPTAFPQACVGCASQKGPLIDTHREIAGGHVYVCSVCMKTGARLLGFAEGEKLDELENAAKAVGEREREIGSLRDIVLRHEGVEARMTSRVKEQEEEIETLAARVAQLEGRLRENAEIALSLVGGEAA
jgi:hypothetical protein